MDENFFLRSGESKNAPLNSANNAT